MKNTFKNMASGSKGFTLVELLIAMAIFVMFTGIVIRSYADIVYSQRGANEYRLLYAESRLLLDSLTDTIRENSIFFGTNVSSAFNSGVSEISFVSTDGSLASTVFFDEGKIFLSKNLSCGKEKTSFVLNDERIIVDELTFYVSPAFDPYLEENSIFNSLQFQPKVTIFLKVSKGEYELSFQTTVSSRNYGRSPEIDITCIK